MNICEIHLSVVDLGVLPRMYFVGFVFIPDIGGDRKVSAAVPGILKGAVVQ